MQHPLRHSIVALAAASLLSSVASAQVRENWRRVFDFGTAYSTDSTNVIAAHPSGGYVIAGATLDSPTVFAQRNTLVVRLDAAGNVLWSNSFTGDPKGDGIGAIAVASSGATYAASSPGIFNQADTRLIKYDALGAQQWVGVYGIVGMDEVVGVREMFVDASENVTFGVNTAGAALSSYNMVLVSYDSAGVQRFATQVDGPLSGSDQVRAIARDSNGDFVLAGSMDGSATGSSLLGLAKLTSNGTIAWTRSYDFTGVTTTQLLYSVVTDAAGNIYACGAAGTAPASFVGVVISYDSAGNFRWIMQLPGTGNALATRMGLDPRNQLVVVANLGNATTVTKYDTLGNFVWQQSFSAAGYAGSVPSDLVVDANGDITICGVSALIGSPVQDLFVVQYDPSGAVRWSRNVDHNSQSESVSQLILSSAGRIALTGTTRTYALGPGFGPNDSFTVELGDQSQPFCYGDGTGTACPCANASAAGDQVGCLNSNNIGARIADAGDASIANDTLTLSATDVPGPALFFQGSAKMTGGAGLVFGDGLLCLSGTITRLGIVFPTGTTSAYPGGLNPNPIHIGGMTAAGDTRHYQAWYRDAAAFCSAATFNLTQGLSVTWAP